MSTHSLIAKELDDNKYRVIYCHFDGYLTHNGAMLVDLYNTPESVDMLLNFGDTNSLGKRTESDKYSGAEIVTEAELDEMQESVSYTYIFGKNHKWVYATASPFKENLKSVENDLEAIYEQYGVERPKGYYGTVNDKTIEVLCNGTLEADNEDEGFNLSM